jgi:hypothetical protein
MSSWRSERLSTFPPHGATLMGTLVLPEGVTAMVATGVRFFLIAIAVLAIAAVAFLLVTA